MNSPREAHFPLRVGLKAQQKHAKTERSYIAQYQPTEEPHVSSSSSFIITRGALAGHWGSRWLASLLPSPAQTPTRREVTAVSGGSVTPTRREDGPAACRGLQVPAFVSPQHGHQGAGPVKGKTRGTNYRSLKVMSAGSSCVVVSIVMDSWRS